MTAHVAQILWHAPRLVPLAAIIAAATMIMVLAFYAPQTRRLPQPWRWTLPLLRLLAGLALAASVLQPALVRSNPSGAAGAVVLLVDASRSMGVTDPRSPAEIVALADGLGTLPGGARTIVAPGLDEDLEALRKRFDQVAAARADVEYAKVSGQGVIEAQTRFDQLAGEVSTLATQLEQRGRSMPSPSDLGTKLAALAPLSPDTPVSDYLPRIDSARTALTAAQAAADAALYERSDVKQVCDELAKLSRAQLAARAMNRDRAGVLGSLVASGLYGYTFADALRPLPGTPAAGTQPAVEPAAVGTDVAGAVRAAAVRMRGSDVQAIVVLTDGRQVGGDSGVMSSLSSAAAPVYAVAIGSPSPRDVAIADVSIAQRQFVDETTTVRVQLRATGELDKSIDVTLTAPGQNVARQVRFAGKNATVEFPLKFDAAGVHGVTVSVAPQQGEITTANNAVQRRVVATSDRASVALVGASASWDFQYVRALLSRAPWATADAEVLDAPAARWSLSPSDIAERALVVLCDVAVEHLTSRQWDALYRLVAERGGSVIFMAGRNTTAPQFIDSPLLTDLLPFPAGSRPAWRAWPGEQPLFRFQPAPGLAEPDVLKLSDGAKSAAEDWLELPALFQYLPVSDLKPNTTPLLVERESGLAVLTESRLGLGRVLFFGVNETWRWRQPSNAAEHARFWLQLIRSVVDPAYAARYGPLRLDADRVQVTPGQSIRLRAKIAYADQPAPRDPMLGVTLLRSDGHVREVMLNRDQSAAGHYVGTLDDLDEGVYELQLRDPQANEVTVSLPLYVQPDVDAEMRDVSADHRTLRRLAESTKGEFLTLAEWKTLPQRLRAAGQNGEQVEEWRLWDSPQLFAFVLGCLGIEWAMRKRLGLA